ncbi:hypothetical protein C1H46_036207 [Malus baccata]|uniref:Uncharacterized protein n=1 Tax=Malus baccata TaxID=106549 RepID=A0A540KW78_MALBA|nr:hypothetical protein C1H46_036207 [Malus baccata]
MHFEADEQQVNKKNGCKEKNPEPKFVPGDSTEPPSFANKASAVLTLILQQRANYTSPHLLRQQRFATVVYGAVFTAGFPGRRSNGKGVAKWEDLSSLIEH